MKPILQKHPATQTGGPGGGFGIEQVAITLDPHAK
jgi:hypothetical protein